jgi:hypothetical protein
LKIFSQELPFKDKNVKTSSFRFKTCNFQLPFAHTQQGYKSYLLNPLIAILHEIFLVSKLPWKGIILCFYNFFYTSINKANTLFPTYCIPFLFYKNEKEIIYTINKRKFYADLPFIQYL